MFTPSTPTRLPANNPATPTTTNNINAIGLSLRTPDNAIRQPSFSDTERKRLDEERLRRRNEVREENHAEERERQRKEQSESSNLDSETFNERLRRAGIALNSGLNFDSDSDEDSMPANLRRHKTSGPIHLGQRRIYAPRFNNRLRLPTLDTASTASTDISSGDENDSEMNHTPPSSPRL